MSQTFKQNLASTASKLWELGSITHQYSHNENTDQTKMIDLAKSLLVNYDAILQGLGDAKYDNVIVPKSIIEDYLDQTPSRNPTLYLEQILKECDVEDKKAREMSREYNVFATKVDHNTSGRRIIYLDDQLLVDEQQFVDAGSTHEILLTPNQNNQQDIAVLKIVSIRMGTSYRYDLFINDQMVDKHNAHVAQKLKIFKIQNSNSDNNNNNVNTNEQSLYVSCLLPEIMQIYASQMTKMNEQSEINVDAYHVSLVSSTIGFGDANDYDFQGVVHDCIVNGNQSFKLYSDVVQDLCYIHINGRDFQEMSFSDYCIEYPEFQKPIATKATKAKSSESSNDTKGSKSHK